MVLINFSPNLVLGRDVGLRLLIWLESDQGHCSVTVRAKLRLGLG